MGLNARVHGQQEVLFISSWKGFQQFLAALDSLGAQHFPTILAQLPEGDEGVSAYEHLQAMADELAYFVAHQDSVQQVVLVDSERGHDISMGSHSLRGTLTRDREHGYDLGFDEHGFFVRDHWELNRILFQAKRVEQRLIDAGAGIVDYYDRDQGAHFRCGAPFGKIITDADGESHLLLRYFHIETRNTAPTRFAYITTPLERVLQMAIQAEAAIEWL